MQHLLTEEELSALQDRPTREFTAMAEKARKALLGLVIANTGCIHSDTKRLWYCDECPIGRAALGLDDDKSLPYNHEAHQIWGMACGQSREYSK